MPHYKLVYFDFAADRGEIARLAFKLGGVPSEDFRLARADWPALKPSTPFGVLPVLEVDGQQVCQSNTIARYVGKLAGLYPTDAWQAALCDEILDVIEDMSIRVGGTELLAPEEKKRAREAMVDGALKHFLENLQARLKKAGGQFFADSRLTVADLRVFLIVRFLRSGRFDHLPPDLVERVAPGLVEHHDRIESVTPSPH